MKVKGIQQTINGIKIEFNDFVSNRKNKIIDTTVQAL